ncbi:O-antigen ligase-like membrane protein [Streptomyces brevispora]|uniref:O-antigen ligase-like membrane protein n=1 Tax=Streptomyces brevispora TaxID=887462 RepID=A0A561TXR4_9ACTN|nr:O-antigen ligase-like membrane protein [Streptomyces brevispora]
MPAGAVNLCAGPPPTGRIRPSRTGPSQLGLGSVAGCVAALGVLLCSLAAARMRRRPAGLVGLAPAAGLVVGLSVGTAEDVSPDGLTVSLEGLLTRNRVQLWQDAVQLAGQHPVRGIGSDRFAELSTTARQTLRSDGKPHSAPLQQAAEQGVWGSAAGAGCCTCCGARRAAPSSS